MYASKPYAHAQYGKLVLVVVLVLRSKGLCWLKMVSGQNIGRINNNVPASLTDLKK